MYSYSLIPLLFCFSTPLWRASSSQGVRDRRLDVTSAFSDGRLWKPGRKLRRRCVLAKLRIKRTSRQEGKHASREGRSAGTRCLLNAQSLSLPSPLSFFPVAPLLPFSTSSKLCPEPYHTARGDRDVMGGPAFFLPVADSADQRFVWDVVRSSL